MSLGRNLLWDRRTYCTLFSPQDTSGSHALTVNAALQLRNLSDQDSNIQGCIRPDPSSPVHTSFNCMKLHRNRWLRELQPEVIPSPGIPTQHEFLDKFPFLILYPLPVASLPLIQFLQL